jgi:pyruvate formate lyase activating enzyme
VSTDNGNTSASKAAVAKPVYDITPFTLLDFPDKTACILWFAGCNMRCAYCYNPDIVRGKGNLLLSDVLRFIHSRKNLLDGVVLSGGECTLHREIFWLSHKIKSWNMSVKIDTNGSRPEVLKALIDDKLVDYIALDFKALPGSFEAITRSQLFATFEETLKLLLGKGIPFEVRTTVHSGLMSKAHISAMVQFLESKGYHGHYYLQHFVGDSDTLEKLPTSSKDKLSGNYSTEKIDVVWRN